MIQPITVLHPDYCNCFLLKRNSDDQNSPTVSHRSPFTSKILQTVFEVALLTVLQPHWTSLLVPQASHHLTALACPVASPYATLAGDKDVVSHWVTSCSNFFQSPLFHVASRHPLLSPSVLPIVYIFAIFCMPYPLPPPARM